MKYADAVHTNVDIRLSVADRFRVLLHGRLTGHVRVQTENVVGRTATDASFGACPLWTRGRGGQFTQVEAGTGARFAPDPAGGDKPPPEAQT